MDTNNSKPKFAVLGAGHGGTAMAGHLSLLGIDVSLYNRGPDRIRAIQDNGGLEIVSNTDTVPHGHAKLDIVTTDMKEAIEGREILMV
ncbi:MAG: NAD(P)-binding domain-containing protein, partial [Youngiibacter sp.]|nr:NAD(P)-binding domain-containing protein [Youngiibacter sp.]